MVLPGRIRSPGGTTLQQCYYYNDLFLLFFANFHCSARAIIYKTDTTYKSLKYARNIAVPSDTEHETVTKL